MPVIDAVENTESAMRAMFDVLASYMSLPFEETTDEDAYWGQRMAQDVIAGSIIQIACMNIRQKLSKGSPTRLTLKMDSILIANKKPRQTLDPKFFWGRDIDGLPLGSIIHAARNLYAHNDANPNKNVRCVFDHLSKTDTNPVGFNLNLDRCIGYMVSANVLHRLGWHSKGVDGYLAYKADMQVINDQ
jgi:hypothetical protein